MPVPTVIPLILSGGSGTRLWPLSRESSPKPFMRLPDGGTLLGKTAARAAAIPGAGPLVTLTRDEHYFATRDAYGALGPGFEMPACVRVHRATLSRLSRSADQEAAVDHDRLARDVPAGRADQVQHGRSDVAPVAHSER